MKEGLYKGAGVLQPFCVMCLFSFFPKCALLQNLAKEGMDLGILGGDLHQGIENFICVLL